MTADGAIAADAVDANGSEIMLTAGQNLTFDMIEGTDSDVALRSASGSILTEDAEGYIRLFEGSALTLAAGADIGRSDARLMIDVPETLTVRIETVTNLYLDGVELEGDAFEGKRPEEDIGSGRNENGMTVSGDWMLDAGTETVSPVLAYQTP